QPAAFTNNDEYSPRRLSGLYYPSVLKASKHYITGCMEWKARTCKLLTLLTVVIYQCYCVEICDEISKVPGTDDEYEKICVDPDYVDDIDQDDLCKHN
ncbi:unnamed protein product, partial [Medioppia subpectinata]